MSEKKKVYILHEYGAKSHYRALSESKSLELDFYEFALIKLVVKSIYYKDFNLFLKQFKNITFLVKLIFSKPKTIVFGMAPFDIRIVIFYLILTKHDVIYHSSWPDWEVNVPKVYLFNFIKKIWKNFLGKCIQISCVTDTVKESIIKFSGIPNKKVKVVSHSLPVSFLTPYLDRNEVKEGVTCLFVGRIEKTKGIDLILKLAKLKPEITFIFVGENRDRYNLSKLDNVTYLGVVKDKEKLKKLYKTSDYLLLPSIRGERWQELFGLVIIEAMSLGCIPLCTDNVGPKSILTKNFSELVFSEKNYIEKVISFIEYVKNDSDYKENLIKNIYLESKKYSPKEIEKLWNL